MRVSTQDLYYGAYLLSKGSSLADVQLGEGGRRGRPSITFVFTGENLEDLSNEFKSGQAVTNVASFKVAMTHLKDVMFNTLRAGGYE
jgi:hypothetical protein